MFIFSFENLKKEYDQIIKYGYNICTCEEYIYFKFESKLTKRTLVNRVDIDYSCTKARKLAEMFNELGIKATFFVRLHAKEYNPFSFENYKCLKFIKDSGHEIGLHTELVDSSLIWKESSSDCLFRDIYILNSMLGIQIKGSASHKDRGSSNNLDFWKNYNSRTFGLLYEAYDKEVDFNLMQESLYISDSAWTQWKCYDHGKMVTGDAYTPSYYAKKELSLIYLLIHPDTYYVEHFYE